MSDSIALVLNSREQARAVRLEFMQIQREHLAEVEDSVIVSKDDTGQVKLDQTINVTATGATSGDLGVMRRLLARNPARGTPLAHHYRHVRCWFRGVHRLVAHCSHPTD
jgi:uncharacterized membrane protein